MSSERKEKRDKDDDKDNPKTPPKKSQHDLHKEDPEKYSDDEDEGDEPDGAAAVGGDEELLRRMLQMKIAAGEGGKKKEEKPKVLDEVSFSGIVSYIKSGRARNVITMAGAGISTSAGIPDFRSPGTGLYNKLARFGDLPSPEAIFSIEYFRKNPVPFYQLARELYPGNFTPTPSHYFVRLLEEKGLLLRHYTQNIDTLERVACVSAERLVEAHGTFHTAHCIACGREYSQEWVRDKIFSAEEGEGCVPRCEGCEAAVKPDVVFFGEALPERFFRMTSQDLKRCDLLIVMGTSLTVQPFASLVDRVPADCPRLLINLTKAGNDGSDFLLRLLGKGGMDFDSEDNYRDVARLGTCDGGCEELAEALGWKDDLEALVKQKKDQKASSL